MQSQMGQLVDGQKDLEHKYQSILAKKLDLKHKTKNIDRLTEVEREVLETGGDLKNSTHVFSRSVRQNPLTGDNMSKIQQDRYISWVQRNTVVSCFYEIFQES